MACEIVIRFGIGWWIADMSDLLNGVADSLTLSSFSGRGYKNAITVYGVAIVGNWGVVMLA